MPCITPPPPPPATSSRRDDAAAPVVPAVGDTPPTHNETAAATDDAGDSMSDDDDDGDEGDVFLPAVEHTDNTTSVAPPRESHGTHFNGIVQDNSVSTPRDDETNDPAIAASAVGAAVVAHGGGGDVGVGATSGDDPVVRREAWGDPLPEEQGDANDEPPLIYQCIQDFDPQEEVDLGLQVGDLVTVLGQIDEHWLMGRLGDEEGIFPASFTTPYPPLPSRGHDDDSGGGGGGMMWDQSDPYGQGTGLEDDMALDSMSLNFDGVSSTNDSGSRVMDPHDDMDGDFNNVNDVHFGHGDGEEVEDGLGDVELEFDSVNDEAAGMAGQHAGAVEEATMEPSRHPPSAAAHAAFRDDVDEGMFSAPPPPHDNDDGDADSAAVLEASFLDGLDFGDDEGHNDDFGLNDSFGDEANLSNSNVSADMQSVLASLRAEVEEAVHRQAAQEALVR
eukprot:m.95090 g.95090  ORF g.95090 m.95090 type:complete len:446 (+) comp10086_c2_seq1:1185-2522(+)